MSPHRRRHGHHRRHPHPRHPPTIEYAIRRKAKVILASHLGRPKGKHNPKYSLRPVVDRLRELLDEEVSLDVNVGFSPDCVGDVASELASQLESGQVLLLENLRFHAQEEANDPTFAKKLASLGEIYINDAFGSAHRAHASTEGITHYMKTSRRRPAHGKGTYISG